MLYNKAWRAIAYQLLAMTLVIGTGVYVVLNLQDALAARNIATGFGFLLQPAGFAIGETLLPFNSTDAFWRAYAVGITNTLFVSALAIVGATVVGVAVAFMRLSRNPLLSGVGRAYVEGFRNTPQLVQVIFWYALVTRLPHPRNPFVPVEGVLVSNRGLYLPAPAEQGAWFWALIAACLGLLLALAYLRHGERRRHETGRVRRLWPGMVLLVLVPPLLAWWLVGAPTAWVRPELQGFRVVGGFVFSPEFIALFLGLSLYIAAFIAEIVRAGLNAVSQGQREAARALGLKAWQIQRLVVVPQALRVIVPPATAQYVSLVKNSSLGVAIGYPELFNVNNTILTLSGHVLEAIAIMMAVYLSISLAVSAMMNAYNRSVQVQER